MEANAPLTSNIDYFDNQRTMEYRKASLNDLVLLAELFNAYRIFYKQVSNLEASKAFLKERITNNDSEIFVGESSEGHLIGFVQLYPIFSSTKMKRLWLLNDLFVNPKYRGKGISVQLIDCAKNLAKTTESAGLILETAKSNTIGNNLYPRAGFELDQEHNYYSWEV